MRIFTTFAVLAALSAPAMATDVYAGGGYKDAPVDNSYHWSGFYLGGFLGMHANNTVLDVATLASLDGIGSQGLMGGGEIGYDVQAGNIVFGVFGRGDFPTAESSLTFGTTSVLKDSMGYMWTAGGRAGLLVGQSKSTLLFGEVGYSQAQYELTAPGFSWTRTPGGITAGAGIETQIGNGFSAKLLWDWTGLESVNAPAPLTGLGLQTDVQRVQIGIDYKLNLGRGILN